jgi:hypothetical protein
MRDIEQLLDDASVSPGVLDLERVHREGQRRRQRPRVLAAVVVAVLAVAGGIGFLALHDDQQAAPVIAPATTDASPATTIPPTTTSTLPPATTPAPATTPTTTAPAEDPLASARLGYEGFGPIKLGMNFDEAVAAAHATVGEPSGCSLRFDGETGSGLGTIQVWLAADRTIDTIEVYDPTISTISGIHVGSPVVDIPTTYPNAVPGPPETSGLYSITNPQGRVIVFLARGDVVSGMILSDDVNKIVSHIQC